MNRRLFAGVVVSLFIWTSALHAAAQRVWTGATNNLWSELSNWTGSSPPGDNDIAIFPSSASNKSMNNDLSVSLTSIEFQGGSYTVTGNDVSVLGGIASASGLGSTPNTFSAKVKLAASQTFTSTSGLLVFSGIDLNGFNLTFAGTAVQQVFQSISGDGQVIKNGTGQLLLAAANSYTGQTVINGGFLNLSNSGGLGTPGAGTTVNGLGSLHTASIPTLAEPLQLTGFGPDGSAGALYNDVSPTLTLSGGVTIAGATRIRANGQLIFSGVLDGTGALDFVGGTFTLAASGGTFNGSVGFSAPGGTLRLAVDNPIPPGSSFTIPTGATLDLNNHSLSIEGLTGSNSGTILLGSGVLTITPLHSNIFIGAITGSGGLNITDHPGGYAGQDLWDINGGGGINFTGQTDIRNSGLFGSGGPYCLFNGGHIGNLVAHDGTVGGLGGTVAGNVVAIGSEIRVGFPGDARATCNSLSLDADSTFTASLRGSDPYLQTTLTVNNTVTLGGATFKVLSVGVNPPLPAMPVTIIKNNGPSPVNGTFKNWPDGAVKLIDNKVMRIVYTGNGSNDVVLTQLAARGDAQGDLKGDIVWRNSVTGANSQWIMNGPAVAVSSALPTVPDTNWKIAGTGDLDGDGKADYVWRHSAAGNVAVWFMNGPELGSSAALPEVTDTNWKIVGVGDFSGDYKADILWRNSATGGNMLWLMDGSTVVSTVTLPIVADTDFRVAGLGDLQGDGKVDVIWRNISTGANVAWLMDGGTVALSGLLTPVPDPTWTIAGIGDFQGDGKADIVWRNTVSGANSAWLMDAFNTAVSASLPTVPDVNWTIAKVEDLQGDGNADLVWRNIATGDNSIWFMIGTDPVVTMTMLAVADPNWSPGGTP